MIECFKNNTILTQEEEEEEEANSRAREIAISVYDEENWDQGGWPTNIGKKITFINRFSLAYELRKGPLYGYYSNGETAHMIVVTGIDVFNDIVYTNNPWGIDGQQSLEEFKSGFVGSENQDYPLICLYRTT